MIEEFLRNIVSQPEIHSKWLNTLSYWENCGARKLAACEHPIKVKEEMLKHAAEEFRHAHHLKQQIHRLTTRFHSDYQYDSLLGGWEALHYLFRLDAAICRLLMRQGYEREQLIRSAYLLVTYAVEMRAIEWYRIYHEVLKSMQSPVRIHSILLEEEEHLEEIRHELDQMPEAAMFSAMACQVEEGLSRRWLDNMERHLKGE